MKNRRNVPGSKKVGAAWTPKMFEPLTRNMLDSDPPDHTRLRALVHRAFTPRVVERMHERIDAVANALLGDLTSRQNVDLIERYALPIPTTIIAECADQRPASVPPVVECDCVDHVVCVVNGSSRSALACVPPIHPFAGGGSSPQTTRRLLVRARRRRGGGRTVEHG